MHTFYLSLVIQKIYNSGWLSKFSYPGFIFTLDLLQLKPMLEITFISQLFKWENFYLLVSAEYFFFFLLHCRL